MRTLPRVSIVVPMRNERSRVEQLVGDIAAQDYEGDVEVIVADGSSTDGSVELLGKVSGRAAILLSVVDNPGRLIPHGLNAGIRRAGGDMIVRMDCRARYPRDYVRRSVCAVEQEPAAWNAGGIAVPSGETATERAVACAMDSPFGGIGWTRHAQQRQRVDADTVYCGCFPRETFTIVGEFDESLPGNEDEDFNFRIRQAGGRVVLDPTICAYYTPLGSPGAVFRRYHGYGAGKVDVMLKHRRPLSVRSLAPAALVLSLGVLGTAGLRIPAARAALAAEGAAYLGFALAFGWRALARRREQRLLLPLVVAVFPLFHLGYGLGMAHGALRAAGRPLRRRQAA